MTLNIRVTDDRFGAFHRKVAAIADRLDKSLPFDAVMAALQRIHDGQFDGVVTPSTLVLHKTASLASSSAKKSKACFTSTLWVYRDSDIDTWLPKEQAAQAAGSVGVYQLQNPKGTTFREMALAAVQAALGTSDEEIIGRLKEHGLTLTLPAIESMVERQESGEDVGLRTDGYANFAFLEDAAGSVSVIYFYRRGRRWNANVNRLGNDNRWNADNRLLLRNSDTRAL
jgi:hypothetical protein